MTVVCANVHYALCNIYCVDSENNRTCKKYCKWTGCDAGRWFAVYRCNSSDGVWSSGCISLSEEMICNKDKYGRNRRSR